MSQINIRNLSNENDDGSPEIVGVSTFSATSFFVPPKGTTAERPSDCEPGSIRFNTDSSKLEIYNGEAWFEIDSTSPEEQTGGTRGLVGSDYASPSPNDHMELGNHAEFLGVMSYLEMLAMYFVHDGGETSKWRLRKHAEKDFWKFVSSWGLCGEP